MELPECLWLVYFRAVTPSQGRNFPEVKFETPKVQFDVITHWCIICCYWDYLIPAGFVTSPNKYLWTPRPSLLWIKIFQLFLRLLVTTSPRSRIILTALCWTLFPRHSFWTREPQTTPHMVFLMLISSFHNFFPQNDEMVLKASQNCYSPPSPHRT